MIWFLRNWDHLSLERVKESRFGWLGELGIWGVYCFWATVGKVGLLFNGIGDYILVGVILIFLLDLIIITWKLLNLIIFIIIIFKLIFNAVLLWWKLLQFVSIWLIMNIIIDLHKHFGLTWIKWTSNLNVFIVLLFRLF